MEISSKSVACVGTPRYQGWFLGLHSQAAGSASLMPYGDFHNDWDLQDELANVSTEMDKRLGEDTKTQMQGINLPLVMHQGLERYFAMLRVALTEVHLTRTEAVMVLDLVRGPVYGPMHRLEFGFDVDTDADIDELDEVCQGLYRKLERQTVFQQTALVDWAERFWRAESPELQAAVLNEVVVPDTLQS